MKLALCTHQLPYSSLKSVFPSEDKVTVRGLRPPSSYTDVNVYGVQVVGSLSSEAYPYSFPWYEETLDMVCVFALLCQHDVPTDYTRSLLVSFLVTQALGTIFFSIYILTTYILPIRCCNCKCVVCVCDVYR